MRNRISIVVALSFVTSTTLINESMANIGTEILVHDNTLPAAKPRLKVTKFAMWFYQKYGHSPYDFDARKQHKFVERFFPRDEQALDNTIKFMREKRRSAKLRNKKATVGTVALKVA